MEAIIPTVKDVQIVEARGPWDTKSGGELTVVLEMALSLMQNRYMHYKPAELNRLPTDIRGLRVYVIRNLPKGGIGGNEWHRIREEIVFVLQGSTRWMCEDIFGGQRDFILNSEIGIWMPSFIIHTYEVQEAGSELLIIANTLFPEDPTTHDTYSRDIFSSEYVMR